MKLLTTIFAVTLSCTALSACTYDNQNRNTDRTVTRQNPADVTADFVEKAAIGDMFEIESSKLALRRTRNPDIKMLANHIIKDHAKASKKLKSIADKSLLPSGLDAKHQDMLNELKTVPRSAFDSTYVRSQEMAHREAISLYHNYVNYGEDERLQNFAAKTLPDLKAHLDHVLKNRLQPERTKAND